MKKLFETLLIGIFSIVFSGSLFSNTFTGNSEQGIKTDFIQPYEINEISNENTLASELNSRNTPFLATTGENSYSILIHDLDIPENQVEISMVNTKIDTVVRSSSALLEEEAIASFNVFPNPVTDKLFLRFVGWEGKKEIKLLDITGRSVLITTSDKELNEIDISTFPKGIYLIAAKNEFHYVVKKIKIQ